LVQIFPVIAVWFATHTSQFHMNMFVLMYLFVVLLYSLYLDFKDF